MCNHLNQQLAVWSDIDRLVQAEHNVQLDGESLTIAQLVAISGMLQSLSIFLMILISRRHRKGFELSKATKLAQRMRDSIGVVQKHMDGQNIVYGECATIKQSKHS
jgi:hypothetical protein